MSRPYVHPRRGLAARAVEFVANSRRFAALRRRVLGCLPFMVLRSDVVDVVYLTWLPPVEAAGAWTRPGLPLWRHRGLTPFTVLTYRHRHFGPALLGRLRSLFPSPLQSNWRLYIEGNMPGAPPGRTVLFTHNVLSSGFYALGARAMSDALPADLAGRFEHVRDGEVYRSLIESGLGSAPALQAVVTTGVAAVLPPAFQACWADWASAVEALALQEGAVTAVQGSDRLAHAVIDLPIDLSRVRPAAVRSLSCPAVAMLGAVGEAFCFVVPDVPFSVLAERLLPPLEGSDGAG